MKKLTLVTLLVLIALVFSISAVHAKEKWVNFGEVQKGVENKSKAKVAKSDQLGITVEFNFTGMESIDVEENGYVYQMLNLPNGGHRAEVGKPQVPMYAEYIEVPHDVKVSLIIEAGGYTTVSGYDVYPAQEPQPELTGGDKIKAFNKDNMTYNINAFYPGNLAEIDEEMEVRGHRLLRVVAYPVQVNPVTREMRVYSNLSVRVQYDAPKKIKAVKKNQQSDEFEGMLNNFVLNYEAPENLEPQSDFTTLATTGAEYLIITHTDFTTYANNLAAWKQSKGISTYVATTTETGTTTTSIANYIKNAYTNWSPAPTYVLLIGDANKIPVFYTTTHPYDSQKIGTDLYYFTVSGTDYYADIFHGRLPVETTTEANTVVTKILDYDKALTSNVNWYNKMFYPGYFQDDNKDGQEDRQFILTNYKISQFMETKDYQTELAWNYTTGTVPKRFYDGTTIPTTIDFYDDDASATNAVINGINAGKAIVNHRDHGASRNAGNGFDGWGDPYISTSHISSLNNIPTVMFSTNCVTGWFDSETDAYTTRDYECFGEELLQVSGKGVAGFIGATRVSYSGYNDELAKGYFDSMFQNYLTYSGATSVKLGNIMNHGKMYMASRYSATTTRKVEFEIFHVLGDPEMAIRIFEDIYDENTKYVSKAAGKNKIFRLNVATAGTYTIETNYYSASCDTVIYLYDHKWNQIATDDDGGTDLYSLLTQSLGVGTYYIKVIEYGENAALNCTLNVR